MAGTAVLGRLTWQVATVGGVSDETPSVRTILLSVPDWAGTEMTEARARCATCGAAGPMAETVVYQRAPGTVVRCRSCGAALMVVVRHRQQNCVDLLGLAALEPQ
jgi:Family of unknown function (DUF6510)